MTRRLWRDTATADYAREHLAFPGLRIVLRVDSVVRRRHRTDGRNPLFRNQLGPHAAVMAVELLVLAG